MIIDCHTHWGIAWQERDRGDPARWMAIAAQHGITKAFLYPHAGIVRSDSCAVDNDTVAAVAARAPDRLIPVATAWPQMKEQGLEEVRRAVEVLGARALKFHPWLQGFSLADPYFGRICGLAAELRVPIFFHDGTPCYCLPEQIAGLARRFQATRFVLAHAGLVWNWRSAIEAARRSNVWLCLCGPPQRALEIICQRANPDRILWGSDFGFGFADSIGYWLSVFRAARIPDTMKEKILGVNPLHLLQSAL